MQISEGTIKRFQKIFKEDYGRKLSKKEAFGAAYNLLGFFDLLLKVDRRVNPKLYISNTSKNEIRQTKR